MIHLCLIFLSEDFKDQGKSGDLLIQYLQSVFMKRISDPHCNPYAGYSASIQKEANEIMTIVGMFEERAEKRGIKEGKKEGKKEGEDRLKKLLRCLQQQGRSAKMQEIIISDNRQLLDQLYAEFQL